MATTKRVREPKELKTKKREEVKLPEIPVEELPKEKIPDNLNPQHLRAIEISQYEVENARLLKNVEEQNLANLRLSLEILQSKIEKQVSVVSDKTAKYELAVLRSTNLRKTIWPIYGLRIDQSMSYDPETGEIIRETK